MYILTCVCLNVRFRLYVHLYYTKAVLYYFCFYLFFFCFGTSCCLSAAARLCVYLLFFFCLPPLLPVVIVHDDDGVFLLNLLGNWMNFFDTSSRVSFACEVICSRRLTVITLSYFTYEKNKKNNKWKYKKHWNAALY